MPGIETGAPERTETSSGRSGSPNGRRPVSLDLASAARDLLAQVGRDSAGRARSSSVQTSVVMVKPGGTGRPRLLISARLAPLPPSRSRIFAVPSALPGAEAVDPALPFHRHPPGGRPVQPGRCPWIREKSAIAPSAERIWPSRRSRFSRSSRVRRIDRHPVEEGIDRLAQLASAAIASPKSSRSKARRDVAADRHRAARTASALPWPAATDRPAGRRTTAVALLLDATMLLARP